MRTIEDYRAGCRIVLGDAAGRRYSDDVIDMGYREALVCFGQYSPAKETIYGTLTSVNARTGILSGIPGPDTEILSIRTAEGKKLHWTGEWNGQKLYLHFSDRITPGTGDRLQLEIAVPHTIKGLDQAKKTTVSDTNALLLTKGAAASAMVLRAHSVTEIFGKRPEDCDNLIAQSEKLHGSFIQGLKVIALLSGCDQAPW